MQKKRRRILLPLFLLALATVSLVCLFTAYHRIQSGGGTKELQPSRMLVAQAAPPDDGTPQKRPLLPEQIQAERPFQLLELVVKICLSESNFR